MKTFIFSYITSFATLVAAWYPDVMARPFHILPRLALYIAFPMGVLLSMILITLGSMLGIVQQDNFSKGLNDCRAAEPDHLKKSA